MKRVHLVQVGTVRKTHGYAGEIRLAIDEPYTEDADAAQFLFIGDQPQRAVPYKVTKRRGEDAIVTLEGITTKEAASALRGQHIFMDAASLPEEQDAPPVVQVDDAAAEPFKRYLGFTVVNEQGRQMGVLTSATANPGQVLGTVKLRAKEHLIPLHQDLIRLVDIKTKTLHVSLPEGLLEL